MDLEVIFNRSSRAVLELGLSLHRPCIVSLAGTEFWAKMVSAHSVMDGDQEAMRFGVQFPVRTTLSFRAEGLSQEIRDRLGNDLAAAMNSPPLPIPLKISTVRALAHVASCSSSADPGFPFPRYLTRAVLIATVEET